RILGELVFKLKKPLKVLGILQKLFVLSQRQNRLADQIDDLETGFFKHPPQRARGEHGQLKLLARILGQPIRSRAAEKIFQRVDVPALQEMIEGGQLVIG